MLRRSRWRWLLYGHVLMMLSQLCCWKWDWPHGEQMIRCLRLVAWSGLLLCADPCTFKCLAFSTYEQQHEDGLQIKLGRIILNMLGDRDRSVSAFAACIPDYDPGRSSLKFFTLSPFGAAYKVIRRWALSTELANANCLASHRVLIIICRRYELNT